MASAASQAPYSYKKEERDINAEWLHVPSRTIEIVVGNSTKANISHLCQENSVFADIEYRIPVQNFDS
jgi:hypothetical protein